LTSRKEATQPNPEAFTSALFEFMNFSRRAKIEFAVS